MEVTWFGTFEARGARAIAVASLAVAGFALFLVQHSPTSLVGWGKGRQRRFSCEGDRFL